MAYIMLPQQERTTGLGEFAKTFNPALQKAFEYYYAMKMKQPEWDMDKKKLKLLEEASVRETQKAEQETLTGVAKGELPSTSIPQKYLNPPRVATTGLTGTPESMAGIQNLPTSMNYQFFPGKGGTTPFPQRVTPQETPIEAQKRMMEAYATQQQAINPYKALQASKLEILLPIYDKYKRGENLTKDEMILLGIAAKEGGLTSVASEIRDLLSVELGGGTTPPLPPAQSGVDEFGFSIGDIQKGHKYIGNNKWQKL